MIRYLIIVFVIFQAAFAYAHDCEKIVEKGVEVVQQEQAQQKNYFSNFKENKRAYMITLGTWSVGMVVASQLGTNQVSFLLGVAAVILGAPILEQFNSKLRHFVFSPHKKTPGRIESKMTQQWLETQGTFSMNAQMSRNLHVEALQLMQISLPSDLIFMLKTDPNLAKEIIYNKLSELAHHFNVYFEDIPMNDETLARAIYIAIIQYLDPSEFEPSADARLNYWLHEYPMSR